MPSDCKSCTENAAVFLKPCFDRLSRFSQKFDFSWNMHSKCMYFIIRKKTKIVLQVLLCFATALYLIKLVSLEMNAFSTVAFIFIVLFAGFSVTDNWQSHKFWVNIATPDGKYSVFKVSCCKDKKYQKTGYVDDGLTLGSVYNKVPRQSQSNTWGVWFTAAAWQGLWPSWKVRGGFNWLCLEINKKVHSFKVKNT